jgi:acetyl-CoA carboxylase biotin carboxyl carrier protein
MDYKEIKKLMDDFGESKLTEIEVEYPDGVKIKLKKDGKEPKMPPIPMHEPRTSMVPVEFGMPYAYPAPGVPMNTNLQTNTMQQSEVNSKQNENNQEIAGNIVKSPMVGTFYSKSSPTAESFVKVGSKVKKGDTLCIIEAMKLMNEIESEIDGEIVEICAKDGDAVEYGAPLFRIK